MSLNQVSEYQQGRGKKESYGGETSPTDALSPSQRFALAAGIEKAKIFRGTEFVAEEFNLENFQHLKEHENTTNVAVNDDDEDDEDNVA